MNWRSVYAIEAYSLQLRRRVLRLTDGAAIYRVRRGLIVGHLKRVRVYQSYMVILQNVCVRLVYVAYHIAPAVQFIQRLRQTPGDFAKTSVVDMSRVPFSHRRIVVVVQAVFLVHLRHYEADHVACVVIDEAGGPSDIQTSATLVFRARRVLYHQLELLDDVLGAPFGMINLRHKVWSVSDRVDCSFAPCTKLPAQRHRHAARRILYPDSTRQFPRHLRAISDSAFCFSCP